MSLSQNKMATMKMGPLIATMALPAIISMLIQALYNVVDSIFVAKIGDDALSAVSLAFPLQILIIAVAVGTGVGINSLIARKLGQGEQEGADDTATHGITLAIFSGIAFLILGLVATKPFFNAFTTNESILTLGCDYSYIVVTLSIFVNVSIAIEKIMQGTGNMVMPMIQNLCGAITNIILDPILIFGLLGAPKLGVKGAAIATVIGQLVSMLIGILVIWKGKHLVNVNFKGFRLKKSIVADIYKVGFPSIVMQAIASIMVSLLNGILIGFSEVAVSVLGIYFKIQTFVFMPVFGLTQGAMPVMGFNYGAKNYSRLKSSYILTTCVAFIIMLGGTILFNAAPDKLLAMFSDSAELHAIGVPALKIISLSFIGAAFGIVNSTLFQSVGKGVASLIVSVVRQLVAIIPAAFILGKFFGLDAVWFAFPIAEILAFLISFAFMFYIYKTDLQYMSKGE